VFVPKYRKKLIFGSLRKDIGKILRELCRQKGGEIIEGHAMNDPFISSTADDTVVVWRG